MATIATIDAGDVISSSRTDINTNFSNLNSDKIETSYLDTDGTLAANSDTKIATQKAVKTYADAVASPVGKSWNEYAVDAVGTDSYAITLTGYTAYTAGDVFKFKVGTANTGACSLNVSGLGAKTIKKDVSTDLATGDILANQIIMVVYDGTYMQLQSEMAGVAKSSDLPSNKIYISTTEVTFTNGDGGNGAGVEKSVFSTTIPANTLSTNNGVRFKCFISGASVQEAASAWTIKINLGGTSILTLTTGSGAGNPMTSMNGFLEGYILADGATNVQKVSASLFLSESAGEDTGDASIAISKTHTAGTGSGAKDSTGALAFEIAVTMTNNAANDGVFEWLILEKIN